MQPASRSEDSPPARNRPKKLAPLLRGVVEVGFIVFLYYSNLLMGEYERSGPGQSKSLFWSVHDILTETNFLIAIASALVGYLFIEFLRKRI
jgi:hypothetical protein